MSYFLQNNFLRKNSFPLYLLHGLNKKVSFHIKELLSSEGEFLVKEFRFGREGVRSEFGLRLTAKLLLPKTKLPPNNLRNHNFLTKNSPLVVSMECYNTH